MDWSDVLLKIGVGACLGFGIIVLAKLGKKNMDHERKRVHAAQEHHEQQNASGAADKKNNEP